jgi:hypothetical protein
LPWAIIAHPAGADFEAVGSSLEAIKPAQNRQFMAKTGKNRK